MRRSFDLKLQGLNDSILSMGSIVESNVSDSVKALREQDRGLAKAIVERDDQVDEIQVAIEQGCLQAIALQQPMAGDLRTISAILQISTDLERISDHATNIAEVVIRIGTEPLIKPLIDIPRMADMAQKMLRMSLDAFVRRDVQVAEQVGAMDDGVDDLYAELFDELTSYAMRCDHESKAQQAINLLLVARDLERIADHATNVAERAIFMTTGDRIRFNKK